MANLANRGAKAPTSVSDQQDSQKVLVENLCLECCEFLVSDHACHS